MTREQIEADIALFRLAQNFDLPVGCDEALDRAIAHLRTRLARLDGPPPGHVRARIAVDVAPDASWRIATTPNGGIIYPTRENALAQTVVADLKVPEPAAEVEGVVEP